MKRFAYCSSPTVPVEGVILDIVRAADRLNGACGVSGLLLFGAQRYFQLLEGPVGAVSETVARIRADRRHRVIWACEMRLDRRRVGARLPMGYISDGEVARAGDARARSILAAPRREAARDAVRALLDLGSWKYPSSVEVATGLA